MARRRRRNNRHTKAPAVLRAATTPFSAKSLANLPFETDSDSDSDLENMQDWSGSQASSSGSSIRTAVSGRVTRKLSMNKARRTALEMHKEVEAETERRKRAEVKQSRMSLFFWLLRYPVLVLIGLAMLLDLFLLALIRIIVVVYEDGIVWRGEHRRLRRDLLVSKTYEEWKLAAARLDEFMKHNDWKEGDDTQHLYDAALLRKTTRKLSYSRRVNDCDKLLRHLMHACKHNHAGCENEGLYSNTYLGSKVDVHRFYDEVELAIKHVIESPVISVESKMTFFKSASDIYGKTGLALSGGGGMTYYHLGLLKVLFEQDLMPMVISGSSGGSLMAALICTRTNEEIVEDGVFTPEVMGHVLTIAADPWDVRIKRFFKDGFLFHPAVPFQKLEVMTKGHLTFREAHEKTGRVLCITVVPDEANTHKPAKVLNYITAPDVIISSAICASCALPGLLPSGVLLCKTPSGKFAPYQDVNTRWRDGSIRHDIPDLTSLGVTFTIASQVNFHITPFFFDAQGSCGAPAAHRGGRGWRGGFALSTLNQLLMLDLKKWLALCRDMRLLPPINATDMSSIFLQKVQFEGNVTVLPAKRNVLLDLPFVLEDPGVEGLRAYITQGEQKMWPKLLMSEHRLRIEKLLNSQL